jgi:hypothetical protein
MRPRLALSIGAVFNLPLGLVLVVAPAPLLSALGFADAPASALVLARDTGTLLIGVGIIDWLARDAVGPPLRGLLWGNLFTRVAAMAVNSWEFATGLLPSEVGVQFAFGVVLNLALITVFALALRRAYR